jgi:hypothetical protein
MSIFSSTFKEKRQYPVASCLEENIQQLASTNHISSKPVSISLHVRYVRYYTEHRKERMEHSHAEEDAGVLRSLAGTTQHSINGS